MWLRLEKARCSEVASYLDSPDHSLQNKLSGGVKNDFYGRDGKAAVAQLIREFF